MSHTSDPTYLGEVSAVTGASVTVQLAESLSSGFAMIAGHSYRVAHVGSFVRIPQGYQDLYGVVCEVGATSMDAQSVENSLSAGRWMRVELAGEAIGDQFERGLSRHPNIRDTVHIVTEADLRRIYGHGGSDQVEVGKLSSAENISVRVSLDSLVTRHSAVVGSTGAGKSTTIASLLRSIVVPTAGEGSPAARILLLDIHGEYSSALSDISNVFSVTPQANEHHLYVPFWALDSVELLKIATGALTETQELAFSDKIHELKLERSNLSNIPGVNPRSLTADTPVPFSLHRLWYELLDFETTTFSDAARSVPALELAGDGETLVAPRYKPHAMGAAGPFMNPSARGIRRQLNSLRSRLLDNRFGFLFNPGPWKPDSQGVVAKDIDELLEGWLGQSKPITILDLSGVPSVVLVRLIGSILKIIYEALFWSREKTEGGVLRPLLVVMEEAHRYLNQEAGPEASDIIKRIAKEGRKYGVGAMIVSQRPAEIDETVLSQCGTLFALRLSNPADRARVKGALPDNLAGLTDLLPVLRTGEAIIVGEAARLPVRCRISLPPERYQPKSSDPEVTKAWSHVRVAEGYDRVVASWRAQRTTAVSVELGIARDNVADEREEED